MKRLLLSLLSAWAFVGILMLLDHELKLWERLSESATTLYEETKPVDYNREYESIIDSAMNTEPVSVIVNESDLFHCTWYDLQYKNVLIKATHNHASDYRSEEHWDLFAFRKNGEHIIIDPIWRTGAYGIKPETLERIKQTCLKQK